MTPPGMLERAWPEPQAALVESLCRPAAYPQRPPDVLHLETHISHVFIAGDFAYKVKKPVALGFLDYSTLEKRRAACEAELRINRRLAPGLYLDVVPVNGLPGAAGVEAEGEVCEYAVKMRAFRQEDLLDHVLRRGELTAWHVDQLAHTLARFHQALPPAALSDPFGMPEAVMASAEQNFAQLETLVSEPEAAAVLAALRHWTRAEGERLRPVFEQRRRAGWVRECHGDLHLGNIVLYDGEPCVFDAIEFNAALRWNDVMSDVAFLVMDLGYRRRRDLAFRFLNQYLESTGDYAGVAVLRYYLVYRAMVRAKVHALRAAQTGAQGREARAQLSECQAHLFWARALAEERHALLAVLHGFSGSGKTSRSRTLLEAMGAVRIRSDVERKRLHGMDALARGHAGIGAGLYSDAAGDDTYRRLAQHAQTVLEAGFPVLVDATFLRQARREAFQDLARRMGARCTILDFRASPSALRDRVAARSGRGSDASDADVQVLERQMASAEALSDEELTRTVVLDTEHLSQREIRELGRDLLRGTRA